MNYKAFDLDTYRLHIIKTDKFKTIDVKLFFQREITRERITIQNTLMDMLTYATHNYPSKKDLMIRCQELYSLYLGAANFRFGNYLLTKIGISLLNPKYTEEGMLEEGINLLSEVLFNPFVENKCFSDDILRIIKNDLVAETKTIKEQPRSYSNMRMLELMGKDEAYAFHGYSDLSILDKINNQNLYDYYQDFITNSRVDVVVVGDVDFDQVKELISNKLPFKLHNKINKPIIIEHDKVRENIETLIESDNYKQSKLSIGCKIYGATTMEFKYVMNIYNTILGGSSNSLLMKMVREKHSLAYYINSTLSKTDNIIIIDCGINSKNYKKVLSLIKKSLEDMRNGNFSEEDFKKSQIEYISILDSAMESTGRMADIILGKILFNTDDIELRKKKILEITKKDVIDFASKVNIDTIYLLRGE